MKVLVLLFLVGCASAFAPRSHYDEILETSVDNLVTALVGDAEFYRVYRADDGDTQSELERKLRDAFEKLLQKIEEAVERGQTVKEDVLAKLKDLRERLREKKIDMGERAKELYKKIKEKAKDFLQNLLDKLGLRDEKERRAVMDFALDSEVEELIRRADDNATREVIEKLREAFDRILERVKSGIAQGKIIKQEVIDQLKELRERLRDLKVDMSQRAKDIYEIIKKKAKDYLKNLLDRLGLQDKETKESRALDYEIDELVRRADEDSKTEIGKKLREAFDVLLERIKDEISRGKIIKEQLFQQLKEIAQRMRELKVDLSDKAKEIFNILKEKSKDYIKNLLEKLGLKDEKKIRAVEFEIDELVRRAEENDVAEKLRDALNQILEKIKDAVEKGKTIREDVIAKLKELTRKITDKKINVGDKAKELYLKIREKARDFLKNLLDNLGKNDKRAVAKRDDNIRNIFQRLKDALLKKVSKDLLKEKVEKLFGKGTELAEQLIELLKTKGETGKQKLLDFIDRVLGEDEVGKRNTRSLQDVYNKVRDYFKNLKIELREKYVKFGQWVKETVKKGVDTSKSKLENIKAIAKEFVEKAKEVRKDIAVEAMEFLRPYKQDLGVLWEHVKKSVKDVLNKED